MKSDAAAPYPNTRRTWLLECFAGLAGGPAAAMRHVMEAYAEPLRAHLAARFRLAEEESREVLHEFFAARVGREDYVREYFERFAAGGMPLRRWLWNGLCFQLREIWRKNKRAVPVVEGVELLAGGVPDLAADFDRGCATALAKVALRETERRCREEGFAAHWEVFEQCRLAGVALSEVARRRGVGRLALVPMLRVPERRFREEFLRMLAGEGVPVAEGVRVVREMLG